MSDPFIAEIKIMSFGFAPKGWALCNGQLLPINQNQALFSLLGTTYGGNGTTTFALPDLRGRTPIHSGTGPGLPTYILGESAGEESHTLISSEMASHLHQAMGTSDAGNSPVAAGGLLAAETSAMYGGPAANLVSLASGSLSTVGGSQPHNNMQPFLALNFCIALVGIFPPRN
jgi:microcystin-dependent protein